MILSACLLSRGLIFNLKIYQCVYLKQYDNGKESGQILQFYKNNRLTVQIREKGDKGGWHISLASCLSWKGQDNK